MARDDKGRRSERGERAAKRLKSGIAHSKAVVADYRARLTLLRDALARPSGGLRTAPWPEGRN
jgi:hypothetical protein